MTKLFFIILLILGTTVSKAQYEYKTVHQDTINIRGIVYDALGKPVPSLQFISQNTQMIYDGYPIWTTTDDQGRFQLNGALPKDTLHFYWDKSMSVSVNGSRFIEIHLPSSIESVPIKTKVEIFAKRKSPKRKIPSFKIITNQVLYDYFGFGISAFAEFRGGDQKLVDYVKSRLIYPEKAIENNAEGDVEIGFTVQRDGSLTNYHTIRGIGYDCEEAVIAAIKDTRAWRPAILNGRPVASKSSVTITFKLTDN
jgi:TonB family protein